MAVDQATGLIYYTDTNGVVGEFDPSNNVTRRWAVGGTPRDVAVTPSGLVYATVEGTNQIVEIDPTTSAVRVWAIPGGGLDPSGPSFDDNPDGIGTDSAGRIWFAESVGDNVTRLDPATGEFAQYAKVGLDEPQNVTSSGSGVTLQTFFSERAGNSVGIVTEVEAVGTAAETLTLVANTTPAIIPISTTLAPFNETIPPTSKFDSLVTRPV